MLPVDLQEYTFCLFACGHWVLWSLFIFLILLVWAEGCDWNGALCVLERKKWTLHLYIQTSRCHLPVSTEVIWWPLCHQPLLVWTFIPLPTDVSVIFSAAGPTEIHACKSHEWMRLTPSLSVCGWSTADLVQSSEGDRVLSVPWWTGRLASRDTLSSYKKLNYC